MSKKAVFMLSVVVVFFLYTPAFAWYYAIGGGGGGMAETYSFSLEVGKEKIEIGDHTYFAGLVVPLIFHGDDNVPSGTHGSPCPHDEYRSLGDKDDGTETGLIAKVGMELFHPDTYLAVIAGVTRSNTVELVRSTINEEYYYEQSTDDEYHIVYGIGIRYFPEVLDWKLRMNLGLDIDNRRGITGMVGWSW
ncbi:MAG: hypothetical protein B6I22_09375 [Desulfobacteraceae bacterium 4572_123]|nr:MAG: hypothetical protein B6I22_09375 [Desulfobacteraceae bacterium 4572_123]